MQQAKPSETLAGFALLLAASVLILLGVMATLDLTRNDKGRRAVGLLPEVVSIADRPRLMMEEIVISAPRPSHLIGAVAHLSGINQ